MRLHLSELSVRYGARTAITGVNAGIDGGRVVAVLGPNAAGKTTLLRTISGLQHPSQGCVELDGARVDRMSSHDRAAKIAWVPSEGQVAGSFTIRRVVELGRYAIGPSTSRVDDALAKVDLLDRSESMWFTASAGMKQRTAIARALAQRTPGGMLVMDEPTSALDLRHLQAMGELLRRCADDGDIVVTAMHDIAFAMEVADEVLVLRDGQLVLAGETQAVLTPSSLADVFGVDLAWARDDAGKRHLVVP